MYNGSYAGGKDANYGISHDISYKNINIYCDDGTPQIRLEFNSHSADAVIENVTIESLTVNGERQENLDNFKVVSSNIKDFYLDGKKIF